MATDSDPPSIDELTEEQKANILASMADAADAVLTALRNDEKGR